jgi:hypothetical protein
MRLASAMLLGLLMACGARSGLADPEERFDGGHDAGRDRRDDAGHDGGPAEPDAGRDAGRPRRDAGPLWPLPTRSLCRMEDRFDVIRDDALGPITGLDLAHGDDGTVLFFQSGDPPRGVVARLSSTGEWSEHAVDLGPSGPGSIVHGRLDGEPGYTLVHQRPDGIGGVTLDERGEIAGESLVPGTVARGRPTIAIGADVMVVAWDRGADTEAIVTDLHTHMSTRIALPGALPAATTPAAGGVEISVWRDAAVTLHHFDAAGEPLSELPLASELSDEIVGLDIARTGSASTVLAWGRGPEPMTATRLLRTGTSTRAHHWDATETGHGAVAHDETSSITLAVVSLSRRGVHGSERRGVGRGEREDNAIEFATTVTPSSGAAPSVAIATTGLDQGSFLVLWDDLRGGVHGISARLIDCSLL